MAFLDNPQKKLLLLAILAIVLLFIGSCLGINGYNKLSDLYEATDDDGNLIPVDEEDAQAAVEGARGFGIFNLVVILLAIAAFGGYKAYDLYKKGQGMAEFFAFLA
jgi:hypothetical protein